MVYMPRAIKNKIIDTKQLSRAISKHLKKEMLMRDLSNKFVASILKWENSYFSNVLNSKPTNNIDVYRSISRAIWLSNSEFDSLVEKATQEVYGWNENNFDYALSSDLGNNPDAIKEAQGFLEFVKQKYWIKK